MNRELRILPVIGIGEIATGDDLGATIYTALQEQQITLQQGDILIITQKIVSKAEGQRVNLDEIIPSEFAHIAAQKSKKDAQHLEVVLRESKRIVRMDNGVLITETKHGFICANSGVDESNVNGARQLTLLPVDPDRSAQTLRTRLQELVGEGPSFDIAIIISDTWGRPWRNGQVNMAIGVAGMEAVVDYRGQLDPYGYELQASAIAVADELASAAELVMGKVDRVPVALIRGYNYISAPGSGQSLIRDAATKNPNTPCVGCVWFVVSIYEQRQAFTPARTANLASLLQGRRSVRKFEERAIEREQIEQVLEAARWAPSPHGRQPWRFVVITRLERKIKLADAMGETWLKQLQMDGQSEEIVAIRREKSRQRILTAPAIIIPCLYLEDLDHYPDAQRQADETTMAIQSIGAAIQNMLLMAYDLGLDTGWMCAPLFCPDVVCAALDLDQKLMPQAMILLGYAAADPQRRARLPLSSLIVHFDE